MNMKIITSKETTIYLPSPGHAFGMTRSWKVVPDFAQVVEGFHVMKLSVDEKRRGKLFRLGGIFFASLLQALIFSGGCTISPGHMHPHQKAMSSEAVEPSLPDKRVSLGLDQTAQGAHEAVMRDHFKVIHEIVAALAEGEFKKAQDLTETRLGFAKHRDAMRRQMPEDFPPAYHDLAMAHHHAAEDLAKAIPSENLKQILPELERTLNTCVQCHDQFKR